METLRMKRSLDLDGLHDALPPTCRAVGAMFSDRQLSKRTRHSGDMMGSISCSVSDSPTSSWASRQIHPVDTESFAETVVNSLQTERLVSVNTPHSERHGSSACSSAEHSNDPFRAARDFNPFPVRGPPLSEELDGIVSGLSPLRKRFFSGAVSGDSTQISEGDDLRSDLPQTPGHSTNSAEKLYTHEELRAVVNKALSIQGASLRSEYNGILQSKLAEQFQSFTKFNLDYISRQIKGNPFSYVS